MKFLTQCPLCNKDLNAYNIDSYEKSDKTKSLESECRQEDHTYIQQAFLSPREVYKVVYRVGEGDTRFYLKISEITKKSYAWTGRYNSSDNRITIDQIVKINHPISIEELKKKIKLLLTFS